MKQSLYIYIYIYIYTLYIKIDNHSGSEECIIKTTKLVLEKSNSKFNNEAYPQNKGTSKSSLFQDDFENPLSKEKSKFMQIIRDFKLDISYSSIYK